MKGEPLKKIAKGLDQKKDPEIREGLTECENLDLSVLGSASAANTDESLYATLTDAHSIWKGGLTTSDPVLVGKGTDLYANGVLIASGFSGEPFEFASLNGMIYFTNTTDGLWVYDGTDVYRAGSPVPAVGTFAVADSGVAASTIFEADTANPYTFYVTYVNDHGYDGNPTDAITGVEVVSGNSLDISGIPVNSDADYNITARHLWIQGGTGAGAYADNVLLLTINDNVTTFVYGVASVEDASEVMEIDNDIPPAYPHLFENYGCLFLMEGNTARYAKVLSPEQWPVLQALTISRSGDPIQGGRSWNASGFIWTRGKVVQVIGSPGSGTLTTNFYVKETRSTKGTVASFSITPTPQGCFFLAEDGLRLFDGDASAVISNPVYDLLIDRNTTTAVEALGWGAYWDDKFVFSFAQGATNDTTVIYDLNRGEWNSESEGYSVLWGDRAENILYVGTASGILQFRSGSGYKAWRLRQEFCPDPASYQQGGKFQVDHRGTLTASVFYDDTQVSTAAFTQTSRGYSTLRMPLQLVQRVSLVLAHGASATRDIVYGIGSSSETQRGKI